MKQYIATAFVALCLLSSCSEYNKVLKSADYEYKYEAAKAFFTEGSYGKAATLLEELVPILKGSSYGEEALYMLGMTYQNQGDYVMAANYFTTYYTSYPRGEFTEEARFQSGRSLYLGTPEFRLDQTNTYNAIRELQVFIEFFPSSARRLQAQDMIFELQDRLVEKEYYSAKLYYDLGTYTGNSSIASTGNNYQAAIVTAQNVLKDYPYTSMREALALLILKAKYGLAKESVEEKKQERMQDVIDEYYAFKNDFPESKSLSDVESIFKNAMKYAETSASE